MKARAVAELGAGGHAAAAAHAAAVEIVGRPIGGGDPRGLVVGVPGPVDAHPGLHLTQPGVDARAVHQEVAHHRELGQRLEGDGPVALAEQLVHQGGAGRARAAVDRHGAGPAHLLHAVVLPHHRLDTLAAGGHRLLAKGHEDRQHVVVRLIGDGEVLPIGARVRPVLAPDPELDVGGHGKLRGPRAEGRGSRGSAGRFGSLRPSALATSSSPIIPRLQRRIGAGIHRLVGDPRAVRVHARRSWS